MKKADPNSASFCSISIIGQERQNELLEELVEQMHNSQKQRAIELGQWKDANPILARRCRAAAEALSQVQTEFLHKMTVDGER